MDIMERVRTFVVTNFYVADPEGLPNDASLISLGVIDSTGVLEVICFLEQEFGIVVEDADATPGNLESIERISAFVARNLERIVPDEVGASLTG